MKGQELLLKCETKEIADAPQPAEVLLPLRDFDIKKDKKKLKEDLPVKTGQQLKPGFFSTVTGTIKGFGPLTPAVAEPIYLRIAVSDSEEIDPLLQAEPDFLEQEPQALLEKLNRANLGFCEELQPVDTVVVSAVDEEPLIMVYGQLLRENKERVFAGLRLLKHLTSAQKVVLAVPQPLYSFVSGAAADGIEVHSVVPRYPNGLPEILIRDMAAAYNVDSHLFLNVEKLLAAAAALTDGKPFSHKVVTVIDKQGAGNYRVRIGTPLAELLKDRRIKDNDKVIIGGPFRGSTCFDLSMPVTAATDCIYIQDENEVAFFHNNQCLNCGRCVRACPVDLDVNLLGRYAEFAIFDQCLEMDLKNCIECGLCAYVCPSGRSLVQLLRLAKSEGEKLESELEKEAVNVLEDKQEENKEEKDGERLS
ncbi:MAG: 4Fe-4S binding protein [Candidatus Aminicenantes bacterium]|nr:4Fe-4S binding protein [Candidatus Aminicenantes bacterium]